MRSRFLAVVLLGAAPACVAPAPEGGGGGARLGVVGGAADTTHDAVVAVLGDGGDCSGTIIHVAGDEGVVLTAAHCLETSPDRVVQGDDVGDASAVTYTVTETLAHPRWNGSDPDFDLGLLRISGTDASTPFLPVATAPDGLKAGDEVLHVGYGVTSVDGSSQTVRQKVRNTLDEVSTGLLTYDQADGGPCSGDSGGPALSTDGPERVVGVIGSGDGSCAGFGIDARVAPVVASFVEPFLGVDPVQSCDACTGEAIAAAGSCADAVDDCLNDAACAALVDCVSGCSDERCLDACRVDHGDGLAAYQAIFTCVCDEACVSACAGDDLCADPVDTDAGDTDAAADSDEGDTEVGGEDTGEVVDDGGCGCATGRPAPAWLALAAGLLLASRRRARARR